MKKLTLIILGLALGLGGYYYWQMKNPATTPGTAAPETTNTEEVGGSELTTMERYTLAEVATHNHKDDCWLVMEGVVYEVTPYVQSGFHPGKEAILMGCGKDATELFNNRPNGSGAHSENARKMLQKYYKGLLATE